MGKVVSLEEILRQRPEWNAKGKRVAFLAGRFDLLHPGHIRLLEQAREMGDIVAIGIFRNEDVAAAPNDTRPSLNQSVMPANERAEVLAALAAVDVAFEINVSDLIDFLRRFRPEAIVDGAHPSSTGTILGEAARTLGIKIIRVPLEPGHSSSRLVERMTHLPA